MQLKYCIGFIIRGNEVLMLNRNKSPNKGLWNGVGGKLELNETPEQSIIREVAEETGISITSPIFTGKVYWEIDHQMKGGMYAFIIYVDDCFEYETPIKMDEGILEWKTLDWLLDEDNYGVVSNIRSILPAMMANDEAADFLCYYHCGKLTGVKESEYISEINRPLQSNHSG